MGNLLPCSTYTYRAFVVVNNVTYYGDTVDFTLPCYPTTQIDTVICYGDTFSFLGQNYSPAGWYYTVNNNITYILNVQYYAARENTIYAEIEYGDSYWVNGVAYTASGRYHIQFAPDAHGCDSTVNLTLRVVHTSPSVWDGTATPWVFGDGTAQMPYQIENASQLAYMANEINSNADAYAGDYFELVADIDLNGHNWAPIGNTSTNPFQGYFDGNNHFINDLNITVSGNNPQYIGLFGYISRGEVSNVHITGNGLINVSTTNTTLYIGSIAGYAFSSIIDNCSNETDFNINNTGTTTIYNTFLGGIVGYVTGDLNVVPRVQSFVTNSLNKGKVNFSIALQYTSTSSRTWFNYIGGVAGACYYSVIENCGNIDSLVLMNNVNTYYNSSYIYSGGIAGYVYSTSTLTSTVKKGYNKGKIILNNLARSTGSGSSYYAYAYAYIGGITGYCNTGYTTITDCYNRGDLEPNAYSYHSSYYNCSYNYVGGITGYLVYS
ncbi:MAG TPA: hypothetical protein PLW70_08905, partial [Bacteroidales bacterium]|nr:hypothetical protein [Bacteroidales bacterium]